MHASKIPRLALLAALLAVALGSGGCEEMIASSVNDYQYHRGYIDSATYNTSAMGPWPNSSQ